MVDVTRGHRKAEFAADRDAVLDSSMLDDHLRAAVRSEDLATLWLAQAHPMALMYFARALGWDNPRYYACIEQADARKSAPAGRAPPAASAPPRTHRSSSPHAR
nr:hypothetical protein [Ramlibacter aurantiacus]